MREYWVRRKQEGHKKELGYTLSNLLKYSLLTIDITIKKMKKN